MTALIALCALLPIALGIAIGMGIDAAIGAYRMWRKP
jgi:hypothetical protein